VLLISFDVALNIIATNFKPTCRSVPTLKLTMRDVYRNLVPQFSEIALVNIHFLINHVFDPFSAHYASHS
jgi:hypothetical protein